MQTSKKRSLEIDESVPESPQKHTKRHAHDPPKRARKASEPAASEAATKEKPKCFNFMGLALELRDKIYELALLPAYGTIYRKDKDERKTQRVLQGSSIFTVSRQVSTEARNTLCRVAKCHIPMTRERRVGFKMNQENLLALFKFRRVVLDIELVKAPLWSAGGSTSFSTAMRELLPLLRIYHETVGQTLPKSLKLNFMHHFNHEKTIHGKAILPQQIRIWMEYYQREMRGFADSVEVKQQGQKRTRVRAGVDQSGDFC